MVNPRANQTDLFRRERLDAGPVVHRGHPLIVVTGEVRDAFDDEAVGAIARSDNLAVFAALERIFKVVQLEPGLGLVAAVAFHTGGVQNGFDVGGVGHTLFG